MAQASGRLVAVLSPERSGSTLLSATLGGHSRVLAPPELHLLRYATFDAWRASYPQAMTSLGWLRERLGEPADEGALVRAFSGEDSLAVYRRLLSRCGPDRLLVDKTPAYARDDAALARVAALEPVYVWLIRHPLAVAASMLNREAGTRARERPAKSARWRLFRADPERRRLRAKLSYWRDVHARLERFLAQAPPGNVVTIHYEAFVREPDRHARRLAAALGLEPEQGMLTPWRNVPEATAWGIGDETVAASARFATDRADAWRTRFDASCLDWRTRRLMARLGVAA